MTPRTMRRVYLREAAVMIVLARLAVRVVSPARIFAWADRPPRRIRRFAVDEIGWVSWAVENVGARPWMKALCLPRALAAHAMLRRRGIASRLCLGVARDRGALSAHAWIEIGDDKVVGGAEADGFTRLAAFGGALP
jgi:hypothetical protein